MIPILADNLRRRLQPPQTGLQLWLTAKRGVWQDAAGTVAAVVASEVQRWDDQSGNARNATNTSAGTIPTLQSSGDKLEIRFDGTDDYLRSGAFAQAQPYTAYIAYRTITWSRGTRLMDGNTVNLAVVSQYVLAPQLSMYAGSWSTTVIGPRDGEPGIIAMVVNGANSIIECNQTASSLSNPGASSITNGILLGGAGALNPGFFAKVGIREVLIYAGAHDAATRAQMKRYLRQEWGNSQSQSILLCCDGDSLTGGVGAPAGSDYPAQLLPLVGGAARAHKLNYGIPSQTFATMLANVNTKITPNASAAWGSPMALIWAGTNDMYFGSSAADVYTTALAYWAAATAAGLRVVAWTVTPRSSGSPPPDFEVQRQAYNTLVRSDPTKYDVLVDPGGDPILGPAGAELNPTYYYDAVHMTAAGYARVAQLVYDAMHAGGYV